MKFKLTILSLVFLFAAITTQAQVFKKLKEAVSQGFEATDETEQESKKKSGKDKKKKGASTGAVTNIPGMKTNPAPPDKNVQLPETYSFSYRTALRIENSKGIAEPVFYLEPGASYYGRMQVNPTDGMTEYMVLDNLNNAVVIFAELNGEKRRSNNYMNLQTKATMMGAYHDAPEKEPVKSIEGKTILGYQCTGYRITTESGTTDFWVTEDAPASLFSIMLLQRGSLPFGFNSMIMEVNFASAESSEKNYQMVCTSMEPEVLELNQSDYQEAF